MDLDMYGHTVHTDCRMGLDAHQKYSPHDPRQFYENDNARGVRANSADNVRKLLLAIDTSASLDDLAVFPAGDYIR